MRGFTDSTHSKRERHGCDSICGNRYRDREVFMKKRLSFIKLMLWGAIGIFILNGCSGKYVEEGQETLENEAAIGQETEGVWTSGAADADEEEGITGGEAPQQGMEAKEREDGTEGVQSADEAGSTVGGEEKPEIVEADWAEYFDGFQGAAVVYDVSALRFMVYNSELAQTRRSPCSTFKIISSLTALEHGIIDPADSVRQWSGEVFWNEKWNKDMDFGEAFRDSCVWYFREVIDEIGPELMQKELDGLAYGNCDISDWEGRLNTNNNNRALTGFWLESSLAISPKEQAEVMERIFGEASSYSEQARDYLKEVMLVEEQSDAKLSIYGKTGMGKAEGIVADAWFAGFAQGEGDSLYFCVYLGRTDDKNVTSTAAKEIAIRLVSDYGKANL